jgi:hypothetical protein
MKTVKFYLVMLRYGQVSAQRSIADMLPSVIELCRHCSHMHLSATALVEKHLLNWQAAAASASWACCTNPMGTHLWWVTVTCLPLAGTFALLHH